MEKPVHSSMSVRKLRVGDMEVKCVAILSPSAVFTTMAHFRRRTVYSL